MYVQPEKNRMAMWSMWLAIIGWIIWLLNAILGFFLSFVTFGISTFLCSLPISFIQIGMHIAAVVMGHMALGQLRNTSEDGKNEATIGLVLGYLSIGLLVISLCVAGFFVGTAALMAIMENGVN